MTSDQGKIAHEPRRKQFRLSAKIIGFFVSSIFLTVAIVMYVGSTSAYESSKERLGAKVELLTSINAASAGGAIRFNKPGDLVSGFEYLIEASGGGRSPKSWFWARLARSSSPCPRAPRPAP